MSVIATRREKVILELEDNFTSEMARAAAATALLDKSLKSLDGSAVKSQRSIAAMGKDDGLPTLSRNSVVADRSINQLTGRLALLARTGALLGPALSPIGAAAVPALSGMATQLGLTVAAAGTAALAFQGVGDALESLNDYQLEPSAENFQKMKIAMQDIGPAGAHFVRFLDSVAPAFAQLQMTAREGLFPGVEDGITSLLDLLPQMDRIVGNVAGAMGQLAREAGAGLSGEGFTAFFDYLESTARPLLVEMGRTIGNFAEGLANMVVGFGPLTSDFSGGLLDMSRAFKEWTTTLSDNQSFQEFLSYVQESAPRVLSLVGSLVDVFVQIAQAMAPVGDVVVPALTNLLDVIAQIADSPLGTMFFAAASGLSAYTLATKAATAASVRLGLTGLTSLEKFNALSGRLGQGAAAIGMVGLAMTDLDDKAGLSNTAMLTLAGTMAGPWGAAAGAAVGFTMDLAAASKDLAVAVEQADRAMDSNVTSEREAALRNLRTEIDETKSGMTDFIIALRSGNLGDFNPIEAGASAFARLTGSIDEAEQAERNLTDSLRGGGDIAGLLAGPLGLTADAASAAAMSMEDFSAAVQEALGILDRREALRGFRQSIRDFNQLLEESPSKMRRGTAAWDEAQAALDTIGRSALTAAEHLRGMDRVNFLAGARKDFLAAAADMGVPIQRARQLANDLGLLNKTRAKPKVDAETAAADGKIKLTRAQLEALGGSKWLAFLDVDASGAISGASRAQAAINGVTGKTVQIITELYTRRIQENVPALAGGGEVLGQRQPYGDKVLAFLAPGEEVISNRNGQADQYRADRAAGLIPHYADGGQVQRVPTPSSTSMRVSFGEVRLGGTLSGGGFTAQVEGIARAAARSEMKAQTRFERGLDRD